MLTRIAFFLGAALASTSFASGLDLKELFQDWDGPALGEEVSEEAVRAAQGLETYSPPNSKFGKALTVLKDPFSATMPYGREVGYFERFLGSSISEEARQYALAEWQSRYVYFPT